LTDEERKELKTFSSQRKKDALGRGIAKQMINENVSCQGVSLNYFFIRFFEKFILLIQYTKGDWFSLHCLEFISKNSVSKV
jgi:hypothetical protein